MPPKRKTVEMATDGVPGKPAHPEYVSGYQIGHTDGHEVGRREGYAAGLAASGETAVTEAEERGYARGFQAAQDAKRPPLFEAAKKVIAGHFDADDDAIWAKISDLEAVYSQALSGPDQSLLEGVVRRYRIAAEAQRQAFVQPLRPKSQVGRDVARKLESGERAETVYEVVA